MGWVPDRLADPVPVEGREQLLNGTDMDGPGEEPEDMEESMQRLFRNQEEEEGSRLWGKVRYWTGLDTGGPEVYVQMEEDWPEEGEEEPSQFGRTEMSKKWKKRVGWCWLATATSALALGIKASLSMQACEGSVWLLALTALPIAQATVWAGLGYKLAREA